jgi:hypothetical protein
VLEGNYEHVNGDKIHADAWPIVSAAPRMASSRGWSATRPPPGALATDRIESVAER